MCSGEATSEHKVTIQDGPVLIVKPEANELITELRQQYIPFLTYLAYGDRHNHDQIADIDLGDACAVLLTSGGDRTPISSVKDVVDNL